MSIGWKSGAAMPEARTSIARDQAAPPTSAGTPPLFLHICPSFEVGGLQDRLVAIVNDLGRAARHVILALDGNYTCARRLAPGLAVETPTGIGSGSGPLRSLWRGYRALRRWRPDLFLTYNWASLEWAAASLFHHPCPHIHHEDGFGPEESDGQLTRRVLFRRVALRRASALVVPSHSLYRLARESWHVRPDVLHRIPNGIECVAIPADTSARGPAGESRCLALGSVAPLRPEKGLDVLLRLGAELGGRFDLRLVIAGTGPERHRLAELAQDLGLGDRVEFRGQVETPGAILSHLDLFVMTSMTEQMPFGLLHAMAAARAVAAFDVGDIKEMVSSENRPYVVARGDRRALRNAVTRLLEDRELRREIGAANARRVADAYPRSAMVAAHEALYESLLDRPLRAAGGA